jgi:predicted membrane protein
MASDLECGGRSHRSYFESRAAATAAALQIRSIHRRPTTVRRRGAAISRRTPYLPRMEQRISSVKLILGLFFTTLGLLMTLDNLDFIVASRYIRWWPMVFIVIGVMKVDKPTTRGPAIVSIIAGVVLLALNTRALGFFDLWPLLLIGAGVVIVTQSLRADRNGPNSWVAVLAQRKVVITEPDFKGGTAMAFLGACELDLRQADIERGPAIIDVFALMAGIEIQVPAEWAVLSDVVPFMGGVEVKAQSRRTGRELLIRGFVMMAGVEVKS